MGQREKTEGQIKHRQESEKRVEQYKADVKHIMSTEQGRRFVHMIIIRAGIFKCSFTGQSNATIFNEGGRNQGLMLLNDIKQHAPGSFELMEKENRNG